MLVELAELAELDEFNCKWCEIVGDTRIAAHSSDLGALTVASSPS